MEPPTPPVTPNHALGGLSRIALGPPPIVRGPPRIVYRRAPNDAFELSDDPNSVLDPPGDDIDLPTARRLF